MFRMNEPMELPLDVKRAYLTYSIFLIVLAVVLLCVQFLPAPPAAEDVPEACRQCPAELMKGETIKKTSLSAHYHGSGLQRNLFVGSLTAIGLLLLLYQGFRSQAGRREATWLSLAGIGALLVAYFPCCVPGVYDTIHSVGAIGLFICLVIVGVFIGPGVQDRNPQWRRPFLISAAGMILGIAVALVGGAWWDNYLLIAENLLVGSFALFWYFWTLHLLGRSTLSWRLLNQQDST